MTNQEFFPAEYLLSNLSHKEEKFLVNVERDFCKTPIRFYFRLQEAFRKNFTGELIFYPERNDAYNKKPHRGFLFTHPEMGKLMCYLLHRTADWFDVVVSFYEIDDNKEPTLGGSDLFMMTFVRLVGISEETTNASYFKFSAGSQGAVSEDNLEKHLQKMKKRSNFQLEILKVLESCK